MPQILLLPTLFDLASRLDLLCACGCRQVSISSLLLRGEELAEGGSVTSTMLRGRVLHSELLHCVSKQNPRGDAWLPEDRPSLLLWVER